MSIIHGAASGRFDDDHEPPRSTRARDRLSHMRATYGLEPDDYAAMVEAQDGRCAICRRADLLNIDHDHETGQVRSLLCRRCNVTLGFLQDDPELASLMADYLRDHRALRP